jgi:large subunit ribosomal protein L35
MPKLKTHKGAKRRLHVTGTGKIMHRKGQISHLRKAKSKRAKSMISSKLMASAPMQKIGRKLLPYGLS